MKFHDCNVKARWKIRLKKDAVMQCYTQALSINHNIKVKVYFTATILSATNIVIWKCHVDASYKGGCDRILGQYIWTHFWLNLKLSEHVIKVDDGHFKGSTRPIVDFGAY